MRQVATRTITVHDRCTVEGCNRVLLSIAEGERGTCGSCWFKGMPADTKRAMNRLIASAFNRSSESERDAAVDDAMDKLARDRGEVGGTHRLQVAF
jgi:hypothetical protein